MVGRANVSKLTMRVSTLRLPPVSALNGEGWGGGSLKSPNVSIDALTLDLTISIPDTQAESIVSICESVALSGDRHTPTDRLFKRCHLILMLHPKY